MKSYQDIHWESGSPSEGSYSGVDETLFTFGTSSKKLINSFISLLFSLAEKRVPLGLSVRSF